MSLRWLTLLGLCGGCAPPLADSALTDVAIPKLVRDVPRLPHDAPHSGESLHIVSFTTSPESQVPRPTLEPELLPYSTTPRILVPSSGSAYQYGAVLLPNGRIHGVFYTDVIGVDITAIRSRVVVLTEDGVAVEYTNRLPLSSSVLTQQVVAIGSGSYAGSMLALHADGSVRFLPRYGTPTAHQTFRWSPSRPAIAMDTNDNSLCALLVDHAIECVDVFTEQRNLYEDGPFSALVMDHSHVEPSEAAAIYALDMDGYLITLQDMSQPQVEPPNGERFLKIVSGYRGVCGLRPDHRVSCWGDTFVTCADDPRVDCEGLLPGAGQYADIFMSAHAHMVCAITEDYQTVDCWGTAGTSLEPALGSGAGPLLTQYLAEAYALGPP